jgi:hypothetical protein
MLAAMAGNDGREWHPTAAAAAWGLWGPGTLAFLVTAWLGELHRRVGRGDLVQLTVREALPLLLASVTSATVERCWSPAGPGTRWAGCCSGWACR